jgi:hypothetical protein
VVPKFINVLNSLKLQISPEKTVLMPFLWGTKSIRTFDRVIRFGRMIACLKKLGVTLIIVKVMIISIIFVKDTISPSLVCSASAPG